MLNHQKSFVANGYIGILKNSYLFWKHFPEGEIDL